jgi:hypothetical protein
MEILFGAVVLGLNPAMIAEKKGYNRWSWWLFGSLLFVIALPAALLLTPKPKAIVAEKIAEGRVKCPDCAEFILADAKICRFCHTVQ